MKYFIYAYPERYGGLHGMYNYELTDNISYDLALEWGHDLAYETVEQYLHADEIYSENDYMEEYHDGEEWDDKYKEEYWDIFDEVMQDECSFEIYQLKEGYDETTYEEWQKENMPPQDFIKRFCEKPVI